LQDSSVTQTASAHAQRLQPLRYHRDVVALLQQTETPVCPGQHRLRWRRSVVFAAMQMPTGQTAFSVCCNRATTSRW